MLACLRSRTEGLSGLQLLELCANAGRQAGPGAALHLDHALAALDQASQRYDVHVEQEMHLWLSKLASGL